MSIVAEAGDVIAEARLQDSVPGQESLAPFSHTVNYNYRFSTVMGGLLMEVASPLSYNQLWARLLMETATLRS